jgi:hypothetical protein
VRTIGFVTLAPALVLAACAHRPPQLPGGPTVRNTAFEVESGSALSLDVSRDGQQLVFDLLGQLWAVPASATPAASTA